MANTLDADGQLLGGLEHLLLTGLPTGLIPTGGLRAGWPDAELVTAISTASMSPVVSIIIGKTTPAPTPLGSTSAKNVTLPAPLGATTTTQINELTRLLTPITFMVLAGGLRGKTVCGQVVSAIKALLGQTYTVVLPDWMVDPPTLPTYSNGLTAQLVWTGQMPVETQDQRQVYRYDLMYSATHSDYAAVTVTLTQGVTITTAISVGA